MSLFQFPANRPWSTIGAIALISAVAALGATRKRAERVNANPASGPGHEFSDYINKNFGSDGSNVLLLVDCPAGGDLFTPASSIAFKKLLQRVQALPDVTGMPAAELLLPMFPQAEATPAEQEASRTRALNNPVIAGNLLAADAKTALVPLSIRPASRQAMRETVKAIEKAAGINNASAKEETLPHIRTRLIGLLPIDIARREAMQVEQRRFQIIGYSLAAILALLFFRGLITTIVVTAPPSIGLLWTLGFLGFSGEQLNSLSMVVMPMILAMIGFTNAAHIVLQLQRERKSGLDPCAATAAAMQKLGVPCMLSAFTTTAGFASLMIAESKMISDFGRDCAIGTLLTFAAVMTMLPLMTRLAATERLESFITGKLKRFLPAGKARKWNWPGHKTLVNFFQGLIDLIIARAPVVVAGATLLTITFGWLTSTLKPDIFLRNQLPDNSVTSAALADVDAKMGGIQVVKIALQWNNDGKDKLQVMAAIESLVEEVRQETRLLNSGEFLLSKPLSVRTMLSVLPGIGNNPSAGSRLLDTGTGFSRAIGAFYRPDIKSAVITVRVKDLGVAKYVPVYDLLQGRLEKLNEEYPDYVFGLAGGAVSQGRYLHRMVNDLAYSLGVAVIIILIMITLAYRSMRVGMIAMLPNLFPLLACAAGLALFNIPLSLEIVCAFTICVGIAADDSIHFLSRFITERSSGQGTDEALSCSFMRVGQVLAITTTVMLCGLGSILFSSLPMYRSFTAVACSTLAAALVADLIILPALIKLFGGNRRKLS
jgi:predicted RND superfamily exporter protein